MPADQFPPLFYMFLGALVLFALQRVVRIVHRDGIPRLDREPHDSRRLDFSVGVVDGFRESPRPERYRLWDNLTAREMEIARLVAQGKHNAEVARELQISPYTVETHLKHTYAKLHVRSRTELSHALRDLVD